MGSLIFADARRSNIPISGMAMYMSIPVLSLSTIKSITLGGEEVGAVQDQSECEADLMIDFLWICRRCNRPEAGPVL
jgi:hypothetical protein